MARKPRQHTIARLGPHGRRVRVWRVTGTDKVVVQCRADGVTKSYRGADAEDRALGFARRYVKGIEQRTEEPRRLTVGELWEEYTRSSDYRQLRPRSQQLYAEAWGMFTTVVPVATPADDVRVVTLEAVRTALEDAVRPRTGRPYALNTIRKAIGIVKGVWAWGERTEALPRNRLYSFVFKVAKDKRPIAPDEYTAAEFEAMLATLSFDKPSQRRAYVALACCGYQGARVNAVLHLRWEDVDFDAAVEVDGEMVQTGVVVWRAQWDKMGNEWEQPMRAPMRAILARLWDALDRPATGWVFPAARKGAKGETYTVQSFWWALRRAEERAGVPHRERRAAHGFRRMVAGDIAAATGSSLQAMNAVGDRDEKQARTYVKRRRGEMAKALATLDKRAG